MGSSKFEPERWPGSGATAILVSSRPCLQGVVSLTWPAPALGALFFGHLLPSPPSMTSFHRSCSLAAFEKLCCVLGSSLLVWGEVLGGGEGGGMQSHARDASHTPARSRADHFLFWQYFRPSSLTHSLKHRLPHNLLNSYPFSLILGLF